MKHCLLAAILAAAALDASAAWEKIGNLRAAEATHLSAAFVKLASFTGNPMIGAMVGGMIKTPHSEVFGEARPDAAVVYTLFLDRDKFEAANPRTALDSIEFAVLYPVTVSKKDFLAAHRNWTETNGWLRCSQRRDTFEDGVDDEADYEESDRKYWYAKYSKDGKWLAASDLNEQVDLALEDVDYANRKLTDACFEVDLGALGLKALRKAMPNSNEADRINLELMGMLKSVHFGVGVSAAGLDVSAFVVPVDGSPLDQCGKSVLPKGFLSDVPAASFATATAPGFGGGNEIAVVWEPLTKLLTKYGYDLSFLKLAKSGATDVVTLDLDSAVRYFATTGEVVSANLDQEALIKDAQGIFQKGALLRRLDPKSPAGGVALVLSGLSQHPSPAARWRHTLGADAPANPSMASLLSLSDIANAAVPVIKADLGPQRSALMKPAFEFIPRENPSGVATAVWRDGKRFRMLTRIGAEEFKLVGAVMMLSMLESGHFGK